MEISGTPAELAEFLQRMREADTPESPAALPRATPNEVRLTQADREILTAMAQLGAVGKEGRPWRVIASEAGYSEKAKRHRLKEAGLIRETGGGSRGMALTAAGVEYERAQRVGVDIGGQSVDND